MSHNVRVVRVSKDFKLLLHKLAKDRRRHYLLFVHNLHCNLSVCLDICTLDHFTEAALSECFALHILLFQVSDESFAAHEDSSVLLLLDRLIVNLVAIVVACFTAIVICQKISHISLILIGNY